MERRVIVLYFWYVHLLGYQPRVFYSIASRQRQGAGCVWGILFCQGTQPERGTHCIRPTILLHYAAHNAVSLFEERLPLVQRVHLPLVQRRVVRHRVPRVQRRHPCTSQRANTTQPHTLTEPLAPVLARKHIVPLAGRIHLPARRHVEYLALDSHVDRLRRVRAVVLGELSGGDRVILQHQFLRAGFCSHLGGSEVCCWSGHDRSTLRIWISPVLATGHVRPAPFCLCCPLRGHSARLP